MVILYTYLIYSFDKNNSNYTLLRQILECVNFLSTYLDMTVFLKFFFFIENLKIVIKLTHKCVCLLCHANRKYLIGFSSLKRDVLRKNGKLITVRLLVSSYCLTQIKTLR